MFDATRKEPPRLHHLVTGVMHGCGRVIHGPDERELVGMFSRLGKNLADLHARRFGANGLERPTNFFWRIGLWVPRVDMAWAADQEQENAVHILIGQQSSL